MSTPASVLVVDDEPAMLRYMRTLLELESFDVETAGNGAEALQRLEQHTPDLVLLDLVMPGMDGFETLQRMRARCPKAKVVMVSCVSDTRKVARAVRLGALDYLTKPFDKEELDLVVHQLLAPPPAAEDLTRDMEQLTPDLFFLASSPAMQKIRHQVSLIATVDVPVLLVGESGSGKEVIAHLIHKKSRRFNRTFMKVNCAALPADLLESELFGYEAGAFTGAQRPKPGKFELCNKGTLLLDEIGEMPATLQAKLLHVLQDGQFSRLGSRSITEVDVRILAATNVDIPDAIASRRFREDLYYRLSAITIQVPPLRDRREEIPVLMRHFMAQTSERYGCPPLPISPALQEAALKYPWPGNLRELGNFVKRYLILGDAELALAELTGDAAPPSPAHPAVTPAGDLKMMVRSLKDKAEADAIAAVLQETGWNRREAAQRLNISYKALLYKIRQYGLVPREDLTAV